MCYRDLQDTEQQAQDTDQKGESWRQDKPGRIGQTGPDNSEGGLN